MLKKCKNPSIKKDKGVTYQYDDQMVELNKILNKLLFYQINQNSFLTFCARHLQMKIIDYEKCTCNVQTMQHCNMVTHTITYYSLLNWCYTKNHIFISSYLNILFLIVLY